MLSIERQNMIAEYAQKNGAVKVDELIKKFDVSFGGALTVIFKNGYTDYVSRRQMKIVKERIGFNL